MTTRYTMGHTQAQTNRRRALECGESHYLGSGCAHGHGGMRYVTSHNCVECVRALGTYRGRGKFQPSTDPKVIAAGQYLYPVMREIAREWGSHYYYPLGYSAYLKSDDRCIKKHEGIYRVKDGQCMSCLRQRRRNAKKANRNRYIPKWLR